VAPFEGIRALVAHDKDLFRSFLPTVADQLCICNTTCVNVIA
jgi:hypothetical protein